MSTFFFTLTFLFFCSTTTFCQQRTLAVEVAAFAEPVPDGYFKEINNVYEALDANYIYRYYIDVATNTEAQEKKELVQKAGFVNARVIDFETLRTQCSQTCQYIPPTKTGKVLRPFQSTAETYKFSETLHCIFFDFDKSFIREDASHELDKLVDVLERNDNFQVEILAHTDARGSLEYNQALSRRRSVSTERYLIKKGIHPSRISKKLFGESEPIALNELSSGEDTELGRQFNRRVEFRILDEAGNLLNVVNKIRVPKEVQK